MRNLITIMLTCLFLQACDWTHEDICETFCDLLDEYNCEGAKGDPGIDGVYGTSDDYVCEVICLEVLPKERVQSNIDYIEDNKNCEYE